MAVKLAPQALMPLIISILCVSLCSTVTLQRVCVFFAWNGGLKGNRSDSSIWVQHSSLIMSHRGEGNPSVLQNITKPPSFERCSSRSLNLRVCVSARYKSNLLSRILGYLQVHYLSISGASIYFYFTTFEREESYFLSTTFIRL